MSNYADNELVLSLHPQPDETVCIISDLHYGHTRSLAPPPSELVASLAGVDILVIAGDLAETRPLHGCREQGVKLRDEFRHACQRAGIRLVELAGNHDTDLPHLMLSLWGGKVIVIHGHMLFDEVAPWGWEYLRNKASSDELIAQHPTRHRDLSARLRLAQAMSLHGTPIHQSALQPPFTCFNKLLHCFWPPQRPIRIVGAWLSAARRAERFASTFAPDCEYLVFGHVHRTGCWKKKQRTLMTTGAWFKHARAARVDFKDGVLLSYSKL